MPQNVSIITLALALLAACLVDRAYAQTLDLQRLNEGQVIIEDAENSEGVAGLVAYFTVAAPADQIWAVLTDYEHFTEVFKGIDRMRVIEENENGAQVEFWVDAVVKRLHYVLDRRYDIAGRQLSWTRISGDLKVIEGYWEIRDIPSFEHKLVVYSSFVKVGGFIPTRLIRWHAKREVKEMVARLRNWLEAHAPDTTSASLIFESDLELARPAS